MHFVQFLKAIFGIKRKREDREAPPFAQDAVFREEFGRVGVQYEGQSLGGLLDIRTNARVFEAIRSGNTTPVSERIRVPPLPPKARPEGTATKRYQGRQQIVVLSPSNPNMHVVKRNGESEPVSFDKILQRIRKLVEDPFAPYSQGAAWVRYGVLVDEDAHVTGEPLEHVDPVRVSQKVCNALYDGVHTRELDELSAEIAIGMTTLHPHYGVLASRIAVSNLHKETPSTFRDSVLALGRGRVSDEIHDALADDRELARRIESSIDYTKDYQCDYFAIKTLMRVYLLTDAGGRIAERPQHMWMRVSLGIHGLSEVDAALQTYKLMSERYFTHATPTLFNSGTVMPQMSSCYLMSITEDDDSIDGIYDSIKRCALISKYGGGIGISVHDVRARGAKIKGTNGVSTGIVPMLKVFNDTARYVNQCCLPETVVYTLRGPQMIKDVHPGDMVVTDDGCFREVKGVFCEAREGQPMIELEVEHGVTRTAWTATHRIMVRRDGGDWRYVEARDMRIGDEVLFPVPRYASGETHLDVSTGTRDVLSFDMHAGKKILESGARGLLQACIERRGLAGGSVVVELRSERDAQILFWKMLRMGFLASRVADVSPGKEGVRMRVPAEAAYAGERGERGIPRGLASRVVGIRKAVHTGNVHDLNVEGMHCYMTDAGIVHNSGKRKGSIAIYLEPWHADIMAFLELKRNHGIEEDRARDLFYALWIPDIFMRRVEEDAHWTLFCPSRARMLPELHSGEFDREYERLEADPDVPSTRVQARSVWNAILTAHAETGVPYILFKDACNSKSNQKNLGTIRSSNLCTGKIPRVLLFVRCVYTMGGMDRLTVIIAVSILANVVLVGVLAWLSMTCNTCAGSPGPAGYSAPATQAGPVVYPGGRSTAVYSGIGGGEMARYMEAEGIAQTDPVLDSTLSGGQSVQFTFGDEVVNRYGENTDPNKINPLSLQSGAVGEFDGI